MKEEEDNRSEPLNLIQWWQLFLFLFFQQFKDKKTVQLKLEAGIDARLNAVHSLESILSLLEPIFEDIDVNYFQGKNLQIHNLRSGRIRKIIDTSYPNIPGTIIYEFTMEIDNEIITFDVNTAYLEMLPELAFSYFEKSGRSTLSPGVFPSDTKKMQKIARLLEIMKNDLQNSVESPN